MKPVPCFSLSPANASTGVRIPPMQENMFCIQPSSTPAALLPKKILPQSPSKLA
eukprot:CAMPEP_0115518904 /NCGR_PEP_ID=MMETSP0271-20121206/78142_1 /TAXON_ID=71861 /ORGANISM="Scrippsiella trochoidea, Strain CCMP3099" /LENGTH=53 /DNA_ID=CAMNT_0002949861 /DNA_START=799 /DNA_END=960 /DNA_ORIENTATION=+